MEVAGDKGVSRDPRRPRRRCPPYARLVLVRPSSPLTGLRRSDRVEAESALREILGWYFARCYASQEGPGSVPFYCDADRVGAFAVEASELASGSPAALFRLFVSMSMFQAQRDVVIMRRQSEMGPSGVRALTDVGFVGRSSKRHHCLALRSQETFVRACDVTKRGDAVDCGRHPGARCHVKAATVSFNRMGDMGKLPTAAWLLFWKDGGVQRALDDIRKEYPSPIRRAKALVRRFGQVHRVGRKLATMFVSALATPALAPGLTPWFPEVDGNELVVVDTNVARAIDALRSPGAARTYDARERWITVQARRVDLRLFHPEVPSFSPRLVQQALYAFCSRSNRTAAGDACADGRAPCATCTPSVCPFCEGRQRRQVDVLERRRRDRA